MRYAVELPVPVGMIGDAVAVAVAEHWRGAARGHRNVLGMVVSTGVGGGLILDGRAVPGPPATPGTSGTSASIRSVRLCLRRDRLPGGDRQRYRASRRGPADHGFSRRRWHRRCRRRRRARGERGRAGRPSAAPARRSGLAIAGAVTLLDLDLVVIGGGVAAAGPLLFDPLATAYTRYAALGFARAPRVVPALLGADGRADRRGRGGAGAGRVLARVGILQPVPGSRAMMQDMDVTGSAENALAGRRGQLVRSRVARGPGRPPSCCAALPGTPRWNRPGRWPGGRRAGVPQVREPAAHRLVQDPRRLRPDRPAVRAGEGRRGGRGVGRQSRPGRGAGGVPARRPRPRCTCRSAPRSPSSTATRAYGADVELVGRSLDDALEAAHAYAARTGAVLVHPFDHPDVLRGQGTVGLEILEQVPDVATVVVAAGGGGLICGVAAVRPGAAARRADRRGAGRTGGRLAGIAARRAGRSGCARCPPWPTASRSASRRR